MAHKAVAKPRARAMVAADVTFLVPEFGIMVATGRGPEEALPGRGPMPGVAVGATTPGQWRTLFAVMRGAGAGSPAAPRSVEWAAKVVDAAARAAGTFLVLRSGQTPGLEVLRLGCRAPVAALHVPTQSVVTLVLTLGTVATGAAKGISNVLVEVVA